jgi:D-alanyl-D-alanine carboxypeptidase
VDTQFAAVMEGLVDVAGPGAAVGVRHGDRPPYLAGFGHADLEWGLSITPDTVFRLGSVTKQFTAAAIMLLVEDGKVGLDDPVQSVLADYPTQGRVVTLRHLLNHTSGIVNFNSLPTFPERTDLTLAEVVALFKDLPPDFAPGERYVYSNSGYVLLGAVIEAVSGVAYRTFLLERFFKPLGMRQTRYLYDEPIVAKRARGYSVGPKGLENARTMSMTLPHAAGALGSTVGDLLTWTRALRGGQVVSAESYAAMIAPARLNDGSLREYGFGLINLEFRGRTVITHLGGINGFATMMADFPQDDLTVVVLSNLDTFPVERAVLALTRRALDLPDQVARPRISVAAEQLERCAGLYRMDASPWPIEITAADGALTTPIPVPHSRYEPFAPTEYQCVDDPELTLHFDQPGEAGYDRLTVQGPMRWQWRTAIGVRMPATS